METYQRIKVGIDVGRSKVDFVILHPDGHRLEKNSSFNNSPEGIEQAKQLLIRIMEKHEFSGVDIAAEATSFYWLPLFIQLQQDTELAHYAPRLTLLNAAWVKWYKKGFPPDHKSDQVDPFYIADRLRTLVNHTWWYYDAHWLNLRFYSRLRFHLSQSLMREKTTTTSFCFSVIALIAKREQNRLQTRLAVSMKCYCIPQVFWTIYKILKSMTWPSNYMN